MKDLIFRYSLLFVAFILFNGAAYAKDGFKVRHVYDGDTILLSNGTHVRYLGINAPEVSHPGNDRKSIAAEPFGEKAYAYNAKLVLNKRVRLQLDVEKYDHYGRLLAYVFTEDGEIVNEKMIQQGLAYCLYKSPNTFYAARFLDAQKKAMDAQIGMWRLWKEEPGPVIGNHRSFRFHRFACIDLKKMRIKNRETFKSAFQAFYQGYAPCKKCILHVGGESPKRD